MRAELPQRQANWGGNRTIVLGALGLCALLAVPVVALLTLQVSTLVSCTTDVLATGEAPGKIEWRITRMTCGAGALPFYDVAVGARDKTLATALTSRGAPVPLEVLLLEDGRIGVRLDRTAESRPADGLVVPVRLRASGTPRERIDLQVTSQAPKGR